MGEKIKENKDEVPFNGEFLERLESTPKIKTLETLQGKVFRIIKIDQLKQELGTDNTLEAIKKYRAIVNELRQDYSINVPAIDYVIGKDKKGNEAVFQVVEEIEGETIENSTGEPIDPADFDIFFCSLIKYVADKVKSGEPYLDDILKTNQFMIGTTKENPKAKIYLIDIDEYLSRSESDDKMKLRDLIEGLEMIMEMMKDVEGKWENIKLEKAKDKLVEILAETPKPEDVNDKYLIDYHRRALEGEILNIKDRVKKVREKNKR